MKKLVLIIASQKHNKVSKMKKNKKHKTKQNTGVYAMLKGYYNTAPLSVYSFTQFVSEYFEFEVELKKILQSKGIELENQNPKSEGEDTNPAK